MDGFVHGQLRLPEERAMLDRLEAELREQHQRRNVGARGVGLDEGHPLAAEVLERVGEEEMGQPLPPPSPLDLDIEEPRGGDPPDARQRLHVPKRRRADEPIPLAAQLIAPQRHARRRGRFPPGPPGRLVDDAQVGGAADGELMTVDRGTESGQRPLEDRHAVVLDVAGAAEDGLHRRRGIEDTGHVGAAVEPEVEAPHPGRSTAVEDRRPAAAEVGLGGGKQGVADLLAARVGDDGDQERRALACVDPGAVGVGVLMKRVAAVKLAAVMGDVE